MLSRLDSIFKTEFRHAEETDTRQAIRRRDPDQRRRNDGDKDKQSASELWHDDISVSVRSVKDILEQLLHKPAMDFKESAKTQPAKTPNNSSQDGNGDGDGAPKLASDQAAKAAQAYQRTWERAHP